MTTIQQKALPGLDPATDMTALREAFRRSVNLDQRMSFDEALRDGPTYRALQAQARRIDEQLREVSEC